MFKKVLEELESIRFPKTVSRKNISSKPIEAFVLGDVNYRGQKNLGGKTRGPSRYNKKFPELFKAIKDMISYYHPNFKYTTIQLNKNVLSPPHIDKNNVGPSYIIGLGDYTGGNLAIEGKKFNIKNKWKYFDGNKGHWTEPFKGLRYSIVFFTHTFKPPNAKLRHVKITKSGMYNKNELIKSYVGKRPNVRRKIRSKSKSKSKPKPKPKPKRRRKS
jgi:hypothetical protein